MKSYFYFLFFIAGCGGKSFESNTYSVPGSTGKIDTIKIPSLKENKNNRSLFLLGPFVSLSWNTTIPTYVLNWVTKDIKSSFQVEYKALNEGPKEAALSKKIFKDFQFYSAVFSPTAPDKEYSYTILNNALSCYTQRFFSHFPNSKWTAVLLTTPSTKKTDIIKKLSPQWIFTSWQPKNWYELNQEKSFFDICACYVWNPLNSEVNLFRSSIKNDVSLTFNEITFRIGTEFKLMNSFSPTFWITHQKIVSTGFSKSLDFLENGFIYLEKVNQELKCSLFNRDGKFLKKYLFSIVP